MAGTPVAALELARQGGLVIKWDEAFMRIRLRAVAQDAATRMLPAHDPFSGLSTGPGTSVGMALGMDRGAGP